MGMFTSAILVLFTAIAVSLLPTLLTPKLGKKGQGYSAPGPWRKVADAYRDLLDSGEEKGGSLALYHRGELVVEFVGGYADPDSLWVWDKDTLAQIFSSTKAAAAVTMAMLVDRGLLEYDQPVKTYWPEFAQNDKDQITVEELLSHQAGLASINKTFSAFAILDDPEKVGSILAEQAPNWTPGEGHGYHGVTLGLYMDQLVRRVDPQHRSLSVFFQEEIAKPFGIDMFIGLPKEEFYRAARTSEFSIFSKDLLTGQRYWPVVWEFLTNPSSLIYTSTTNPPEYAQSYENNPSWREIPNPSTHGFATATGAAKLMGIVGNGGHLESQRLLAADLVTMLTEPLTSGEDKVLLMNVTYGRGVTLRETPMGGYMFGAPGGGGQMMYADPQHQLGWAYFTNSLSLFAIGDDPRYLKLEKAIYECAFAIKDKEGGS